MRRSASLFPLAIPKNSRVLREIERTLGDEASSSIKDNKKLKGYMLKVQQLLGALKALIPPLSAESGMSLTAPSPTPHSIPLSQPRHRSLQTLNWTRPS